MRFAARSVVFMLLALSAAGAAAQSNPNDETAILEESSRKDEGTTSAPPPDDDEQSITYSAVGLSRVATGFSNVEEAINIDVTLIGFRLPPVPWFAIQLDLGTTVVPGQVERQRSTSGTSCPPLDPFCTPTSGSTSTSTSDFASTTAAALAVVRSTGRFYGMGKLGYRYLSTSLPELEGDRSGTVWGGGAGYRWNNSGSFFEVHYSSYSSDFWTLGFAVALGYSRH